MIKYLLFLLPSLTFFDFFFQSGVSVTDTLPESMASGSSTVVEYQINKENNSGFAKLQLDIPFGFKVEAVETKGASFTFSAQTAKFIWMTLPSDPSIKVKYKLISDKEMTGSHIVKGQFSYIKDNERVDYNLAPKTIVISQESIASKSPAVSPEPTTSFNGNGNATAGVSIPEGIINENCYRDMTPIGGGKYLVKVTVKDLGVRGYAKLEEKITGSAKLVSKKPMGAVVTTDKDMIKFVWFDAPGIGEFSIEYEVSDVVAPFYISGKFGFVKNNNPTEMEVGITAGYNETIAMINAAAAQPIAAVVTQPKSENLKSDSIKEQPKTEVQIAIKEEVAQVKPQPEPKKEPVVEVKKDTATTKRPDPVKEEPAKAITKTDAVKEPVVEVKKSNETPKAEPVTASAKSEPKTEISKAPAPEKGISYKVQIMAAHRTVGKAYFQKHHNYSGEFSIENHDGWVKYTTGRHSVYADARNARETIRGQHNFHGPFVTAYNDGVRITVQEALMISNQQWVK